MILRFSKLVGTQHFAASARQSSHSPSGPFPCHGGLLGPMNRHIPSENLKVIIIEGGKHGFGGVLNLGASPYPGKIFAVKTSFGTLGPLSD